MSTTLTADTFWIRIYMSGPIEVAKQVLRAECMREGLCVTIEPTTYIYTGGEEQGFVVGLNQYPKYPIREYVLMRRAREIRDALLDATHQWSAMIQTPRITEWYTRRPS